MTFDDISAFDRFSEFGEGEVGVEHDTEEEKGATGESVFGGSGKTEEESSASEGKEEVDGSFRNIGGKFRFDQGVLTTSEEGDLSSEGDSKVRGFGRQGGLLPLESGEERFGAR